MSEHVKPASSDDVAYWKEQLQRRDRDGEGDFLHYDGLTRIETREAIARIDAADELLKEALPQLVELARICRDRGWHEDAEAAEQTAECIRSHLRTEQEGGER